MRKVLTSAVVFFGLIGTAQAGTITGVGAISPLTNVSQITSVAGTGSFDEGPTSGPVPLNVYAGQGLVWGTGALSLILPGVTTPGNATQPQYATWPFFPAPIGGGGTAVAQNNMFAGVAKFTVSVTMVGLTASTNGTQYLTVWNTAGQMLGQVTWVPGGTAAFVGISSLGVPIGMVAYGNHDLWAGQAYDIGGATIISDSWIWGTSCVNAAQCDDGNVCTTDACNAGQCVHSNAVGPCNDGNACTQTDTCQGGMCVGSNNVLCAPVDACHDAGACNPASGVCSNPNKPDGSGCNDNNACTQSDTCLSGACTGSNPVACPPPDGCHNPGMCSPATGTCSNPAKPDGSACSDANACTQTDTCQAGVCSGGNAVMCPPPDGCHQPGACNAATGMCDNPAKPDGSACSDNDACTQTDACVSGTCTGSSPVTCAASDACHDVGTCDPMMGVCSDPAKPDGTACDDANPCTRMDTCQAGACAGASPVTCTALDECHEAGTCDPTTGMCSDPAKPDGTPCADGTCVGGLCTPMGTGGSGGGPTTGSGGNAGNGPGSGGQAGAGGSSSGGSAGTGPGAGAGTNPGGGAEEDSGGCGCRLNGSGGQGSAASIVLALAWLVRRRRSRRKAMVISRA